MKYQYTNLGLGALTLLIVMSLAIRDTRAQTCPQGEPVCHTITPMGGHGPASGLPSQFNCNCPSDNRRVITITIDSSWGTTTNANIWNAVQCAVNQWNTATDGANPPHTTGYYLVVDQAHQASTAADITIVNQTPSGGGGYAGTVATANGWEMQLANANGTLGGGSFTASDLCGRISHEIGHMLGLNGLTTTCNSVMQGTNTNGTRNWNTVTGADVYQVNRNFDDTTRLNGYCKPPQNLSEETNPGTGGDPGGGDACASDPCCYDPECCGDPTCGNTWCSYVCDYTCSRYCDETDEWGDCTGSWSPWDCGYGDCHQECY